jgi:hypothetical protein
MKMASAQETLVQGEVHPPIVYIMGRFLRRTLSLRLTFLGKDKSTTWLIMVNLIPLTQLGMGRHVQPEGDY